MIFSSFQMVFHTLSFFWLDQSLLRSILPLLHQIDPVLGVDTQRNKGDAALFLY